MEEEEEEEVQNQRSPQHSLPPRLFLLGVGRGEGKPLPGFAAFKL